MFLSCVCVCVPKHFNRRWALRHAKRGVAVSEIVDFGMSETSEVVGPSELGLCEAGRSKACLSGGGPSEAGQRRTGSPAERLTRMLC